MVHIMNQGFARAATSFTKFIGKEVKITNTKSFIIRHTDDFSYVSEETGNLFVLVTEIIGDLFGKSYLIFNDKESKDVFNMAANGSLAESMKEAMLMEIDNIISASVISELSDALKISIYGDVPRLEKLEGTQLQEFISVEDDNTDPTSVILTNTTFQFGHNQEIHPQFIWKLSTKIFEIVPAEQLA